MNQPEINRDYYQISQAARAKRQSGHMGCLNPKMRSPDIIARIVCALVSLRQPFGHAVVPPEEFRGALDNDHIRNYR
jgi:hypothetical protein